MCLCGPYQVGIWGVQLAKQSIVHHVVGINITSRVHCGHLLDVASEKRVSATRVRSKCDMIAIDVSTVQELTHLA